MVEDLGLKHSGGLTTEEAWKRANHMDENLVGQGNGTCSWGKDTMAMPMVPMTSLIPKNCQCHQVGSQSLVRELTGTVLTGSTSIDAE